MAINMLVKLACNNSEMSVQKCESCCFKPQKWRPGP